VDAVTHRRRTWTHDDDVRIVLFLRSGWNVQDIADVYNYCYPTLQRYIMRRWGGAVAVRQATLHQLLPVRVPSPPEPAKVRAGLDALMRRMPRSAWDERDRLRLANALRAIADQVAPYDAAAEVEITARRAAQRAEMT
jgi:hypothetical protein